MDCIYYSKEEMLENARMPIVVLEDEKAVFQKCAEDMFSCIDENNKKGEISVIVVPIGPIGQYEIFADMVNKTGLDLTNTYFLLMDAYILDGKDLPYEHRLSLRRKIDVLLFDKLDTPFEKSHIIAMKADDVGYLNTRIERLGKIDLCVAGIGIDGHIGMNEPLELSAEEYLEKAVSRILPLTIQTRLISAIGNFKGALSEMPEYGITIGLKEMMTARKMRIYCFRDWHNSCIKRTVCAKPDGTFPSTILQLHDDVILYAHENIVGKI